jgi:hypothetical protein
MNLGQRKLARHALGLWDGAKRSYRNRYFCTEGCPAYREWMQMVEAGEAVNPAMNGKLEMFYLTHAAALAVLESGETLDPEDFPNDRLD